MNFFYHPRPDATDLGLIGEGSYQGINFVLDQSHSIGVMPEQVSAITEQWYNELRQHLEAAE